MSYHGLGLLSLRNIAATDTLQPTIRSTQPAIPAQEQPDLSQFRMTYTQAIPSTEPTVHRAPEAPASLPSNYSAEAMGCAGKMAAPINPGNPGYPGFLCIDYMKPTIATAPQKMTFVNTATGGSGSPTGGGRVDINLPVKQTASGMSQTAQSSGSGGTLPPVDTKQPTGTVTPESFAAACKQIGGTMGTPSCCKDPTGFMYGLDNGNLVQVLQCEVPKGGLGGSLPLIAGAAVIALLLTRGM